MKFRLLRLCLPVAVACLYTFCSCLIGQTNNSPVLANAVTLGMSDNSSSAKDSEKSKTVTTTATTVTTSSSKESETTIPMLTLINTPEQVKPQNISGNNMPSQDLFDFSEDVVPDFSIEYDIPITTPSKTTVTTPKATSSVTTPIVSENITNSSSESSSNSTPTTPSTTASTTASTTQTTATTAAPSGWTIKLSVKNNLSSSKDYNQVVTADAYTIVCRVVQAEMGDSFSEEALKAQALAAYSYMASRGNNASILPMSDNVSDKVKKAVSAVSGKAIYYNGSIAQTVYYASSAGATANSYDIWGGHIPYLVSVDCPVDITYDKYYGLKNTFSSAQMSQFIKAATGLELKDNPSKWITDIVRSDGGYVTSVTIGGAGRVTGQQFRANIMQYNIRSANFTVEYNSSTDTFTVTTYGYGHGVGMSQNGANFYSIYHGYNYIQILQHYYTGVTIENVK